MKPSDFQKTIQCQFDCKLKRVVKGIVRNYRKELKRRRNKEISYCELPEIVVEKLACKFYSNGTPILKLAVHPF